MTYQIEFIELHKEKYLTPDPDVFSFSEKKKISRRHRKAWNYLLREKCIEPKYDETFKVTRHTVDGKSFIDKIYKQKSYLLKQFNIEGTVLLVGAEDYSELMCDVSVCTQPFSFNTSYNIGRNVLGLTVKVIPWMRGMAVMP